MPAVVFVRVAARGGAEGRRGGFLLFDRHRVRLLLLQEHTPVTLWGGRRWAPPLRSSLTCFLVWGGESRPSGWN